jgi:RNA polymerase sigma-70 factor (ECF subfamily)
MTSVEKPNLNVEATRQSLLLRLRDWEDHQSWLDFFNRYWRLIYGVARRSGLSDDQAQEVVQETIITLCKGIRNYEYQPERCSFRSWLMLLTRHRIIAAWRKRRAEPEFDTMSEADATTQAASGISEQALDAIWNEEWEENLIGAAAQVVRKQVKSKQFQIYDLYVLKNWPVKRVSETLKVSATQVYLAKHRVGRLMRREIRRLERSEGLE